MYEDDRQLAPFKVSQVEHPHTFSFKIVDSLPAPSGKFETLLPSARIYRDGDKHLYYIGAVENSWETAYMMAVHDGHKHIVQVKHSRYTSRIGVKMVLNSLRAEHLAAEAGGFLFHCSYIDFEGKAILFTAPSGTGKSTQADLWHQHRLAEIINGDRAAVRMVDGKLIAEGIPYSGSSTYCKNRTLPIEAIVYLSQTPKTTIRRIHGYDAFSKIWEGVSVNIWDKRDLELVSGVVQAAAKQIPIFHLSCTPDESAVIALENALRKQVYL